MQKASEYDQYLMLEVTCVLPLGFLGAGTINIQEWSLSCAMQVIYLQPWPLPSFSPFDVTNVWEHYKHPLGGKIMATIWLSG